MKLLKISSKASAPTKVILFGEHFVVYNKPAILAAIDKRIYVNVNVRNDNRLVLNANGLRKEININDIALREMRLPDVIFMTSYNILSRFDSRLGLDINIRSEVPFGSGLGTSAATSAALAASITNLFNVFDKHEIFQMTLEAEKTIHGKPSGADPAICVTGGMIIFRRSHEPDMLIMPLEFEDLNFVIIYSGENRLTSNIVNNVKNMRDDNPDLFDMFANKSEEITLDAIQAIKKKDYESLGALMLRNHELLKSLGVSNEKLDKLVELAMNNGALGAKLTGAGGGGSIIALAKDKNRLLDALRDYQIFIADIDKDGVRIE